MTDMVAGRRLRSAGIIMVVTGLLAAFCALCCCVGEVPAGQPETRPVAALAAQIGPTQSPTPQGAAHVEDCDRSAIVQVAGLAHPGDVVGVPTAVADRRVDPVPVFSGAAAPARPPAPHVLCVMRT